MRSLGALALGALTATAVAVALVEGFQGPSSTPSAARIAAGCAAGALLGGWLAAATAPRWPRVHGLALAVVLLLLSLIRHRDSVLAAARGGLDIALDVRFGLVAAAACALGGLLPLPRRRRRRSRAGAGGEREGPAAADWPPRDDIG